MRTVGCAGQSVTDEQPQRLHMFSHRARRKSPARIRARQAATRKDAGESIADHKHRWENDTPAGRLMPFGVAPLVAAEGSPAASQTRRHSQFCTPGSRATMITQAGHASKRVKPTQPTGRSPQPSRRRAPACFQRPPPHPSPITAQQPVRIRAGSAPCRPLQACACETCGHMGMCAAKDTLPGAGSGGLRTCKRLTSRPSATILQKVGEGIFLCSKKIAGSKLN